MTVSEVIRTKRAVRQFSDEPPSEEAIRSILHAGRRAQSSKNTQPWHFIAIRDRATLRQLAECGAYAGHLAGARFAVALVASTADGFDLGQAAAYMQLAAWDLGIGSCIASMWSRKRPKRSWVYPKISTLMSRFPLVILSPTTSSLLLQNQTGASRSTRWFSGNVGVAERASPVLLACLVCCRCSTRKTSQQLLAPCCSFSACDEQDTRSGQSLVLRNLP